MRQLHLARILSALIVLASGVSASRADDAAYFTVDLAHLSLTEGTIPQATPSQIGPVRLDGAGEAYVVSPNFSVKPPGGSLTIRTPGKEDVTGRLFFSNADGTGLAAVKFKVSASEATDTAKKDFYTAMEEDCNRHINQSGPGVVWFRSRSRLARAALGKPADDLPQGTQAPSLDDTFGLFTGNQALTDNLQLERTLRPAGGASEKEVLVTSLPGIDVAAIDWKEFIKGKNPRVDPLASHIPADQHAIFFADFAAMIAVADEADRMGDPVLQLAEAISQDAGVRKRYERQLGLSLSGLGRVLGPGLVKSVAVTGSDPYLRAGSDIAIVFEPKDTASLRALLTAQITAARLTHLQAKQIEGEIDGVHYIGAVSPDRSTSAYLAELKDGAIVVTNSLAQLEQLAAVQQGKAPALSTAPEYIYFRDRYKLGENNESGLLILTDATIRRWCSARWRIADSRRTRAAAILADLNATHLDELIAGTFPAELTTPLFALANIGQLGLTGGGAASPYYGSIDFLTPIVEMKFDTVTSAEAAAYERWRSMYQSNWRGYFDPIAIDFGVHESKLSTDVTVMPLITGSDYRPLIDIASGAKISPTAGDPHDVLFREALAINVHSPQMKEASNFAITAAPNLKVDPLGWIGQSVSIYADKDPMWKELAEAKQPNDFIEHHFMQLPFAVQIEVSNGFKLAAFLVALHGFVDQAAPGLVAWENLSYKDLPYVKLSPTQQGIGQNPELKNAALYYRATGAALLLTLNEPLLKRSIDRQIDRDAAAKAGKEIVYDAPPMLGESLILQADASAIGLIERAMRDSFQSYMQHRSWENLDILTEWKLRYPKQDPVDLYKRFFQARLVDPAGGQYTWNEKWQTMESSIYGCPAAPKLGPTDIAALSNLLRVNFGVTFENQGVRARAELDRSAK